MSAVVQLRADLSKLAQISGDIAARRAKNTKDKNDLEAELARFGVSLVPMHPDIDDQELARYYTLAGGNELDVEEILSSLRRLDAVTAAYLKPEAELP